MKENIAKEVSWEYEEEKNFIKDLFKVSKYLGYSNKKSTERIEKFIVQKS